MIEVILPSGSDIDACMVTAWLISPLIGDVTTITGGFPVMVNLQFHQMNYLISHKLIVIDIPRPCSNLQSVKLFQLLLAQR